jgi:hypothetical protein
MQTLDERLARIGDALELGARNATERRRARRRTTRVVAILVTAAVVCAGTAIASSRLLGGPAPVAVQSAIDDFIPRSWDGEMAPGLSGATSVARFGDDVLYHLPARHGKGVCLTVLLAHHEPGHPVESVGCIAPGPDTAWFPIGISESGTSDGRQLIFGQVHAPSGATLWIELQGQPAVQLPLGVDGYFLAEATMSDPGADPATTPHPEARLSLRDGGGGELISRPLPLLRPGTLLSP